MYIRPNQHLIRRTYPAKDTARRRSQLNNSTVHRTRVLHELRRLGVSHFGMRTTEAKYLPRIIHREERLGGVLYGLH
jgi:hypothetical protein